MDFNPYEAAKEMNDDAALDSWKSYEDALLSEPVIAITPSPYLQYENPDSTDEYGPTAEIWEQSIQQELDIYQLSLAQAVSRLPVDTPINRRYYTPPSGYGRGGPISYPIELIQLAIDQKWLVEFGVDALNAIVADAMVRATIRLRQWWTDHNVPQDTWRLPSHNPFIVRAVVETHARRSFPNLKPGTATIHACLPANADLPATGVPFLVTLPYPKGSLVYLVDDRLWLLNIIRTTAEGSEELDISNWLTDDHGHP